MHRRIRRLTAPLLVVVMIASAIVPITATPAGAQTERAFRWVSSFDVMAGNGSSVAEIIDTTPNGRQLVYTDGDQGEIGFVNIRRVRKPQAAGTVAVGGEPTSLAILGNFVLVATNTSESFTNPSGELVVVNRRSRQIVARHALDGQPDSLAISPDRRYAAIVIENERDEDLSDGIIPQNDTGGLVIVDLKRKPRRWQMSEADLSPVAAAAFAGTDLEPEYVDINAENEAVITFQENNHIAVVDLTTGLTINQFSAGSATLTDVDTAEEDLITLDSTITKRREPDAVTWIDGDSFATANEGDYEDAGGEEGGSRGFTVFNQDGTVEFESAESFEHWLVAAGHYNEGRSENKGVEPESVEYGRFAGTPLLFVGSERSNAVGVYDVSAGEPDPVQLLATGIGPEGIKVIPNKKVLVVSTESDVADAGIPTMINLYRYRAWSPTYPMIESADDGSGNPIQWVALSGLAGDPDAAGTAYAVSDSFLAEGFVYEIDLTTTPPSIVARTQVTGASAGLDLEGIAVGPDGNFWLGSEGNDSDRPNLVLHVNSATGAVVSEIALPADLVDMRRGNGIEGIAVTGDAGSEVIYVAIQRAWPDEGDTDTVNTKIGRYDVATESWSFVHYPLEAERDGGWIGLSELTLLPDGTFAVIERDKGWGRSTGLNARLKAIYGIDLAAAEFRAFDDPAGLVTVEKLLLRNALRDVRPVSVWTAEKLEGLAVTADGNTWIVTDNDGVDDAPGETVFLGLGDWETALAG